MPRRLTGAQVQRFHEEGFLIVDQPVFDEGTFASLKAHFEKQLQVWEKWSRKSPEHMDVPHFLDVGLFRWLLSDAVLDLVEPLIGPDIALWSSHFVCKPATVGKRVPWHEDSAYWKGRLDPMEVVTVWLAIDPSTPANGCMKVIPRTHGHGFSNYAPVADADKQVFDSEIQKGGFDESKAVDCVLKPNHCSIHHAKLIHGSNANTGMMRRCGYTMRYMPTTVRFIDGHDRVKNPFQVYLARGRDRAGNTYGDPTKVNQAWLDKYPDGWPSGH